MMQDISELIKRHQHTMGKVVLILGSGIPLRPDRLSSSERVARALRDYASRLDPSIGEQSKPEEIMATTESRDPSPAEAAQYAAPHFRDVVPTEGHLRLARLINEGYFPAIFTLGVDDLLERALAQMHLHPDEQYNLVNVGLATRREIAGALADSRRVTLVKMVGTVGSSGFAFTRRQAQSYLRRIQRFLFDTASATTFIAGYAHADADVIGCLKPEGGPLWWINPKYPLGAAVDFDNLKVETPDAVDHHELLPAVAELLKARKSEKLVLTREAGTFDNFFRDLYERRVRRSRDYRTPGRARDSIALEPEGPYRLLESMEVRDGPVFHGRDADLAGLEKALETHRIVVVFGEAGMGKSSLVHAGLARRLTDEGVLAVCSRVGADPVREAVLAIQRAAGSVGEDSEAVAEGTTLRQAARRAYEEGQQQLVLIVDQAEEVITRVGRRTTQAFAEQVHDLLEDQEIGARLALAVCDWALPLIHDLKPVLPELYDSVHRVGLLGRSEARNAVVKPAARFERRWEEGLIEAILDHLGPDWIHPAELQIVCYRCYATLGRARVVTMRAYEALGRAERILSNFLSDTFHLVGWRDREPARQVLRALVRSGDTKGQLTLEQVMARCPKLDSDRGERLLWALSDARLVRRSGRERERSYELVSNWVVPQIAEGMSAEDLLTREVEDAIARQLTDHRHFGEPLDRATQRAADGQRTKLRLTKEETAFVVTSAALAGHELDAWFETASQLEDAEVPLLAKLLRTAPEAARLKATERLDALGSEAAVKVLLDSLGELGPPVRERVALSLERRGHVVAAAVRETSGDDKTRALVALTSVTTPEVVEPLVDVVSDASEDDAVREVAVSALTTLAPKTGRKASPALIARLGETTGEEIDESTARALAKVAVAEGEPGTVYRAAESASASSSVKYAAVLAALELRDADEAERQLGGLLDGSPESKDTQYVRRLGDTLRDLRERLSAGHFEWSMFRKDASHSATAWEDGPSGQPRTLWAASAQGHVVASPSVSGGQCFFGAKDGTLRAVESQTGRLIWSRKLGLSIESAPAIAGDVVIVGCLDHRVYACDRKTGRVKWRAETDGEVRGSPVVVDGRVLVGSWDGHLYCISVDRGEIEWRSLVGGPVYASPACADGRSYVGSWAGRMVAVSIETGHQVYSIDLGAEINSSATVTPDGRVVVGTDAGEVVVLDGESSSVLVRYRTDGPVRSSPAAGEGDVFVGGGDGLLHCFSIDSGERRFAFRTGEPMVGAPVLTPSHVVFGSWDGCLYCASRATGQEVFRVQSSYSVVASPAMVDGVIYVGMEYYQVHALGESEEAEC